MDSWPTSREVEKVKPERVTRKARRQQLRARALQAMQDLDEVKAALSQFEPVFTVNPSKARITLQRVADTVQALVDELA